MLVATEPSNCARSVRQKAMSYQIVTTGHRGGLPVRLNRYKPSREGQYTRCQLAHEQLATVLFPGRVRVSESCLSPLKGIFVNPMALRQILLVTFVLSAFSAAAVAQRAAVRVPAKTMPEPPASASQPVSTGLSTDDILAMVKAGLGEDVIILAIRQDDKAFDLSALQLVQLKQSGVSDNILKVMLDPQAEINPAAAISLQAQPAPPAQPSQQVVAPVTGVGVLPFGSAIHSNPSGATTAPGTHSGISVDVNDPDTAHDSGVYLYTVKNDARRMIAIERAAYQVGKTGGMFAAYMTGGFKKAKSKAIVSGN